MHRCIMSNSSSDYNGLILERDKRETVGTGQLFELIDMLQVAREETNEITI